MTLLLAEGKIINRQTFSLQNSILIDYGKKMAAAGPFTGQP